jgi:hypothetical protein
MTRNSTTSEVAKLLTASAVRSRCQMVLAAAERNESAHFRLVPARLDDIVQLVVAITRRRYPDLDVPYHARWRHFAAGGVNRASLVSPGADVAETARASIDLAIVAVLLDAGAGATWSFREEETGQCLVRSEGLGVASLRAMEKGLFSSDPHNPWRADAAGLSALSTDALARAFQHTHTNSLVGLAGRTRLLRRLGEVSTRLPQLFGTPARLGNLYDYWASSGSIKAVDILGTVLQALGPIWPKRIKLDGVALGDCGRHSVIPGDGFVPFHKLSQWLTYSLVEPLEHAGCTVTGLDGLTGLAEYRNGGLFLDGGLIEPLNPDLAAQELVPTSEAVVEWRALTVALLDRLAPHVRHALGVTEADFPLAKVLEGGTWAAGRELAYQRRSDGSPPLKIKSDGTWF